MRALTSVPRFLIGAGLVWRGITVWSKRPGLMLLGVTPGLISVLIFVIAYLTLLTNLPSIAATIAGFVATPGTAWHGAVQVAAALGIVVGALLLTIYSFTALTMLIGAPFFERISANIDLALGHQPFEAQESRLTSFLRSLRESTVRLVVSACIAVLLFLATFIPMVGTFVAGIAGMLIGGWFIASEVTQYPLERRGYTTLKQRRSVLRADRATTLGFGAMAFVMFLIPGGAVLTMPAVVSGGTLLARHATQETIRVS